MRVSHWLPLCLHWQAGYFFQDPQESGDPFTGQNPRELPEEIWVSQMEFSISSVPSRIFVFRTSLLQFDLLLINGIIPAPQKALDNRVQQVGYIGSEQVE